MKLTQEEVLEMVVPKGYYTASELLEQAVPNAASRFDRTMGTLNKLLKDVQKHFPDAQYYSANGTMCLLLGDTHDSSCKAQQQLVAAFSNAPQVGGGDW